MIALELLVINCTTGLVAKGDLVHRLDYKTVSDMSVDEVHFMLFCSLPTQAIEHFPGYACMSAGSPASDG